jgi:hypothetical protein
MNTTLISNMAVNAMRVMAKFGGKMAGYGGRGAELMGSGGFGRSVQKLGLGAGNFIQGLKQGGTMGFGAGGLRGTGARTMLNAPGRGLMAQGMRDIRAGGRGLAEWGAGANTTLGQRATRLGGGYVGARAGADFLNPWGIGWGD